MKKLFPKTQNRRLSGFLLLGLCASVIFVNVPSFAQDNNQAPVDLQADRLIHDDSGQSVTAIGDVILIQAGKQVKADKIVYNLKEDTVIATGSVEFTDINGDVHTADRFEFNDAMKEGFVEGLQSFLVDGSRFVASNGKHVGGDKTLMKDAFYTPCEVCEHDPDATPLWQIRASEVEHDKIDKKVKYRNARFEIKGVPIAYLPYFEHPDGTVKRKSGFLTPSAGFSSDLGTFVESSYYWNIAPDQDMTVGLRAMTKEAPLALLEWRKRWANASLIADGSLTYSQRTDRRAGVSVREDDEVRGHISVDGVWDINNKWRSGINLDLASDDQFLRQYDFDSEDVLENEVYVERFSGRNYAVGRLLAFQDLRVAEEQEDEPNILPEIEASFLGEPGAIPVIGGRWSADASILGITRDNNGQDVNRLYSAVGWQRRMVSDFGLVSVFDAELQGMAYHVNDRVGSSTNPAIENSSTEGRAFGYINAQTSYPMQKQFENSQMVIEPIVAAMVSPDMSPDSDIPNEDSQDVQIDALNIFEPDRFPGVDGIEDQSHVTYGVRTGLHGYDGSFGDVFIGQSYRFEDHENPFNNGSGLDQKSSDIVGQVTGSYKGDYTLDYRFQLDNEDISPERHEVDAYMNINNLQLSSQYLYAKALEGTDISETREQIRNAASYYVDDNWRIFGAARHDLGDDPGLRTASVGVDFTGQCFSWSVIGQRNLTDDSSGDSGTEVFFRLGFKNLGEFETSGFQIGGDSE